jgi:hypothetical protein
MVVADSLWSAGGERGELVERRGSEKGGEGGVRVGLCNLRVVVDDWEEDD